jgi:hypothetical protein
MLNKAKILNYQIWDAETGEADVIAELKGDKIKAFSLDFFDVDQEYDVILSLFCKDYETGKQALKPLLANTDDNYQVDLQGTITKINSSDEEGFVLTVDAGGIFVNVYIPPADQDSVPAETGLFFKGNGRLDIELEHIS